MFFVQMGPALTFYATGPVHVFKLGKNIGKVAEWNRKTCSVWV